MSIRRKLKAGRAAVNPHGAQNGAGISDNTMKLSQTQYERRSWVEVGCKVAFRGSSRIDRLKKFTASLIS